MACCPNCGHAFNSTSRRTAVTARQRDLLDFITAFASEHEGMAPSFREMAEFMGLASLGGIHRLVSGLEERGHIRRLNNRARAIVVIGEAA